MKTKNLFLVLISCVFLVAMVNHVSALTILPFDPLNFKVCQKINPPCDSLKFCGDYTLYKKYNQLSIDYYNLAKKALCIGTIGLCLPNPYKSIEYSAYALLYANLAKAYSYYNKCIIITRCKPQTVSVYPSSKPCPSGYTNAPLWDMLSRLNNAQDIAKIIYLLKNPGSYQTIEQLFA